MPFRRRALATFLLAGFALACSGVARASGLQVSPVSLTIEARQGASGLWLSNTGKGTIHAQIRVYRWTQPDAKDLQQPSRGLVVSPPMLVLEPGQKQLVRVIRTGTPPTGPDAAEQAFRLSVDELPVDAKDQKGLSFVLHYSLPVFVEPAGGITVAPDLHWRFTNKNGKALLVVSNSGSGHAQLVDLQFIDASGHTTTINGGLMGYVLPHATMRWALEQPVATFADGGSITVRINGQRVTQHVASAPGTP